MTRKKLRHGLLRAVVLLGTLVMMGSVFGIFASAAQDQKSAPPGASVKLLLDGKELLEEEAVIIRSVTYVPLRRFCEELGADDIQWNAKTATATVFVDGREIRIKDGSYVVEASGRYFYTPEPILNWQGRLYVPVRPLAKAFCLKLDWNGAKRAVVLKRTDEALISGTKYYDSDELYWLSRIISAEAGGESLYGKIAVGNVVMNRVADGRYPNTIYGVVFDRKGGTQFSPVAMGTIYRTPTAESVLAAKICLEGYSISDEILFFMNPRIATNNWISKNRPFAFSIGRHDFYK